MKVYVASKVHHVQMWRTLREEWAKSGLVICSRWIDEPSLVAGDFRDESVTQEYLANAWVQNMEDVAAASALVTYADEADVLRGALVEIGAMMSYGCPILIVGYCSPVSGTHGSWQFHPNVHRVPDMDAAKSWLLDYTRK